MKFHKILLDDEKPNQAQLKLYSQTAADLAKAILLASGAGIFIPAKEGENILFSVIGFAIATALFITASRLLKGVKEK